MEPVAALAVRVGSTESVDVEELAGLAARTFPLACPPSVTKADIAAFVENQLSAGRFGEYLADPDRKVLTAAYGARIAGYAMLVRGVIDDPDVQRAVTVAPAVELSKMYVLPHHHGCGVAAALMDAALVAAADMGGRCVWLGVNQLNQRAQRFYAKHGFKVNGVRTFRVGAGLEHDHVMIRAL